MVRKLTGRIAVPIAAALTLLVTPLVASATDGDGPNPALIDPNQTGSVTIVKLGSHSQTDNLVANGAPVDLSGRAITRIGGVQFSIRQLKGDPVGDDSYQYDLTTAEGWKNAKQLADEVHGNWADVEHFDAAEMGDQVHGCTGWSDPDYPEADAEHNAQHCKNGGVSDEAITSAASTPVGELTFSDLPVGLYLVSEENTPDNVVPAVPFLVTVPMTNPDNLAEWMYDVTVYPKNALAGVTKTVDDSSALVLGDEIEYKISMPLPDLATQLILTDILDPRLEFSLDPAHFSIAGVDSVPQEWAASPSDGTADPAFVWVKLTNDILVEYGFLDPDGAGPTPQTANVLRVTFTGATVLNLAGIKDSELGFTFKANVNAGGAIPNTASYIATVSGGEVRGDATVETKWGGFDVLKTDADSAPLSGASFNVAASYADAVAGKFLFEDSMDVDDEGRLSFTGLRYSYWEDGKVVAPAVDAITKEPIDISKLPLAEQDDVDTGQIYWLVETKAPNGYELQPTPIPVRVLGPSDPTVDVTVVNVPSNAGYDLPTIGGNRAILPILGGLVVVGGVVLLVRSRRVND